MANSEMSDCVPSVSRILLEKYHKEETNLFNLDIFAVTCVIRTDIFGAKTKQWRLTLMPIVNKAGKIRIEKHL